MYVLLHRRLILHENQVPVPLRNRFGQSLRMKPNFVKLKFVITDALMYMDLECVNIQDFCPYARFVHTHILLVELLTCQIEKKQSSRWCDKILFTFGTFGMARVF
jgi:uncharacterized membrane protein